MVAIVLIATIALGGAWWIYKPSSTGFTDNQFTENETEIIPGATNVTSTETDEIPEITNANDTAPETPQFNETEVIVIDDLRFFSWKARRLSAFGFGTILGNDDDDEIKTEMDAYLGITLEITSNVTREMGSYNYATNGTIVKRHNIFFYSGYEDYMLECIIADDSVKDFQDIKIGDVVTFRGKLFAYNKVSEYETPLPGSLPKNTILYELQDCRIVETP